MLLFICSCLFLVVGIGRGFANRFRFKALHSGKVYSWTLVVLTSINDPGDRRNKKNDSKGSDAVIHV